MAIFHLRISKGQKGKITAVKKSNYISRQDQYQKPDLAYTLSGNMPSWATTTREYWQAIDTGERENGRLFREFEFALPKELSIYEQEVIAKRFAKYLTDQPEGKLPFELSIHDSKNGNPHCHLLISERANDGIARTPETWCKRYNKDNKSEYGAKKVNIANGRKRLQEIRAMLAKIINARLQQTGIAERVDHRSLKAQGVDRPPTFHIGPNVLAMEKKGIKTEKMKAIKKRLEEIENHKQAKAKAKTEAPIQVKPKPEVKPLVKPEVKSEVKTESNNIEVEKMALAILKEYGIVPKNDESFKLISNSKMNKTPVGEDGLAGMYAIYPNKLWAIKGSLKIDIKIEDLKKHLDELKPPVKTQAPKQQQTTTQQKQPTRKR